ncbi:hypothetical protein CVT25_002715 [Psilocybe cyanescens]|uniref:hAT-like transposase RNase-H fold domain-containing protein n=1 Tax=Psilocybe cyanescens TaxID=93625 RepID=A0A409XUL2_PSICY|nr:hypothetical protein CVT25_002715 [Psilocybe cyanescens]
MVMDKYYQQEVDMLCPGTKLPSSNTVQKDLLEIYTQVSVYICNYFMKLNSTIHLVLDGWTAPLGLVVIWYKDSVIHRAILEFIWLTKKHDGWYLDTVVADCLKWFGLDKNLLGPCKDNASNCNKLAEVLPELLPDFWGTNAHLQCLAHIINLVTKIFISFFFKKPKVRKTVKVMSDSGDKVEQVLEAGDDSDPEDSAIVEEAMINAQEAENDTRQIAHDDVVVLTLQDVAIQEMADKGVIRMDEEEQQALKLFPAVYFYFLLATHFYNCRFQGFWTCLPPAQCIGP